MTFQIFSIAPRYDDRDGIIGSQAQAEPNTYITKACAQAIADRLDRIFAPYSDLSFVVVPYGTSPYAQASRASYEPTIGGDEIPF